VDRRDMMDLRISSTPGDAVAPDNNVAKQCSTEIIVSGVTDFAALGAKWRDLESRSAPSFFQSWTWTGCLVSERFPDPVLVEAREGERTVALALFNRRGRTLHLGESGDPGLDCIYIEFNGVLAETGRDAGLAAACLRAARTGFGPRGRSGLTRWSQRRLVLNGIQSATVALAAEIGYVRCNRSLAAPFVDLAERNRGFLDGRSANTRQQLRRSDRDYAAGGGIVVDRASTLAEAEAFLDGLIALHQKSWVARGQAGAFANPFFRRFHRALIERGLERHEIDLLRIAAGQQVIGFLYNFRHRAHSLAYQSGFDYGTARRHEKPGLTCHYAAIRFAEAWGAVRYDFLAGDDRYKRSLSDGAETLEWIEVTGRWSPRFLAAKAREFLARHRGAG
jgi:CelD/BcsL family acetyltransferase involved in cellulose biosynthesis